MQALGGVYEASSRSKRKVRIEDGDRLPRRRDRHAETDALVFVGTLVGNLAEIGAQDGLWLCTGEDCKPLVDARQRPVDLRCRFRRVHPNALGYLLRLTPSAGEPKIVAHFLQAHDIRIVARDEVNDERAPIGPRARVIPDIERHQAHCSVHERGNGMASEDTTTATTTISEATFLLTELRYTLGQTHVQIGDLDQSAREASVSGDRSVADILSEMRQSESRYQEQYSRILGVASDALPEADTIVPLPINAGVSEMTHEQQTFEKRRGRTIALLETANDEWSHELFDLVRQQVADDRRFTTSLAACRSANFQTDSRPDLDEPLTTTEDDIIREPTPSPESVRLETTSQ
jgi:hypothetical protein